MTARSLDDIPHSADMLADERERAAAVGLSVNEYRDAMAGADDWSGRVHALPTVVDVKPDWQARRIDLSPRSVREDPPPRVYLLHDAGTGEGVLVKGKVGLFAAVGGTGKSWAFAGLAVAVASGRTWFGPGGWAPARPGRVLILLAEEDAGEVMRRLHFCAREAGITSDADLAEMCANLDAFGLTGTSVALTSTSDDDSKLPLTSFAKELHRRVLDAAIEGTPYDLIIIDPLSRFAGGDVEKDNAAATRWVQTAEMLTSPECGEPSVLAAHHLRKPGKDDDQSSASLIRGASALVDGVRWAAILEQQKRIEGSADLLILRVVKSNGAPPRDPITLCRPSDGNEGVIRVATRGEVASHPSLSEKQMVKEESLSEFTEAVVRAMPKDGESLSRNEIRERVGKNKAKTLKAIGQLIRDGVLVVTAQGVMMPVPGGSGSGSRTGTAEGSGGGSSRSPPKGGGELEPLGGTTSSPNYPGTGSSGTGTGTRHWQDDGGEP